jgi:hypothetical protein
MRRKAMTESEYYAGEFDDADLHALADRGDFHLEESGFYQMPSLEELRQMAEVGETLLLIDFLRTLPTP